MSRAESKGEDAHRTTNSHLGSSSSMNEPTSIMSKTKSCMRRCRSLNPGVSSLACVRQDQPSLRTDRPQPRETHSPCFINDFGLWILCLTLFPLFFFFFVIILRSSLFAFSSLVFVECRIALAAKPANARAYGLEVLLVMFHPVARRQACKRRVEMEGSRPSGRRVRGLTSFGSCLGF